MEQVNTTAIYLLGKWMDSAFLSARMPLKTNIQAWQNLEALLDILLTGDARLRLNESANAANQLRHVVRQALERYAQDAEAVLTDDEAATFNTAWGAFEQALGLDLGRAPIYFVTPKGIFSTDALINYAQHALTEDVRPLVSDPARADFNQAGRCVAFGLNTAAGFHALRAVEKVLRDYYVEATGIRFINNKPLEESSMAAVINGIRHSKKGDDKVLATADQLRDLHRNPIDHPEIFLTPAEAIELFNICASAVSAMARDIDRLKKAKTPTPPTTTP